MLLLAEKAAKSGKPIPTDSIKQVQSEYFDSLLKQRVVKGDCDDEDIQMLVEYHWPHVFKSQKVAIDWWQCKLIRQILAGQHTDMKEIFIKGCTKAGKGYAVAIAACLWYQAADACKIIVTSNTATHAEKVMFGEILNLRKKMRRACNARHGAASIKTSEDKYMATASPEKGEAFSGQHGPQTMFVFDEATGVRGEYWELAETQANMSVALANPRTATGWFRAAFPAGEPDKTQIVDVPGGRRGLHTIGGLDCINVKSGEHIIPNQIDRSRYESIKAPSARWGRVFGDGRFPEEDETTMIIVPSWLIRHHDAWTADMGVEAFGLDMAASDSGDRTVLAAGGYAGCRALHEKQSVDTMGIVAWVIQIAKARYDADLRDGSWPVTVDMDGLGKGAGDRLAELGVWVLEFRGNASSVVDSKRYANLRAEAYGELGRRLDPRGAWPDEPWALPRDSELVEDLCAPERVYRSDGMSFRITPKVKPSASFKGETIFQKLGRSPDRGDAVAYLYHAVRERQKHDSWKDSWEQPLLASGGDDDVHDVFSEEELQELPDDLKELVEQSRISAGDRDDEDF